MPPSQFLHAGLQVRDRLLDCHVQGEEGYPSLGQVVTRFLRKHCSDGMNTSARVFSNKRFADPPLAAPMLTLAGT